MVLKVNAAHLAAKSGKDSCLEIALAYGHDGDDPETLKAAIEGGHLNCIKLLCEKCNPPLTGEVLVWAAKQAQTACVAYIAPLLPENGEMFVQAKSYQWPASASFAPGLGDPVDEGHPGESSRPTPDVDAEQVLAGVGNGCAGAEGELSSEAQASPLARHAGTRQGLAGVGGGGHGAKQKRPAEASALPRRVRTRQGLLRDAAVNPWTVELPAKIPPPGAADAASPPRWYQMRVPDVSVNRGTEAVPPSTAQTGVHLVARVCNAMAQGGDLTALRTLVEGGCANHMDAHTFEEAVEGGSVECVRYALGRHLSDSSVSQTATPISMFPFMTVQDGPHGFVGSINARCVATKIGWYMDDAASHTRHADSRAVRHIGSCY